MCICACACEYRCPGKPEEGSDVLKLELQVFVTQLIETEFCSVGTAIWWDEGCFFKVVLVP